MRALAVFVLFYFGVVGVGDKAALRRQIEQTLHVPHPLPPVEAKMYGSFSPEPGITVDRVTYATQLGMRVPANVYHPTTTAGQQKRPAVIVVNGHGGDKYTWYAVYAGMMYARAGAVVLTYDPIGEGERNAERKDGTRQHDPYVAPDENGRYMGGLMMMDLRQAVSYLSERPDVDPTRIAAAGYSMGSFITSIACAVETRLHACASTAGGYLDGPGGYWDQSSKKMCQAIPYQSLAFLGDRPAVLFALNADRGPLLIHNGSADEVVRIPSHDEAFFKDMRERTIKLVGSDHNVFSYSFTPEGGHRPYFVTRPVATWLNEQLHFPNWPAISASETHISEWAAANHVLMDKQYSSEHTEGGTMALGKDIRFPAHDLLNAVPEAEWRAHEADYTYEGWLARVRAELTSRQ